MPSTVNRSPRIFLCYRRKDWAATDRIYDRLCESFGKAEVFRDVGPTTGIPAGAPWRDYIRRLITTRCRFFIVVIGPNLFEERDQTGRRRLDYDVDPVREEIRIALNSGANVIPVLLEETKLPEEKNLPPDIRGLLAHNAIEIRRIHFRSDVRRLIDEIRNEVPLSEPDPFRWISTAVKQNPENQMEWIPTLQEFRAEKVRTPRARFDDALERIRKHRELTILGRGAAGKTTFALALGFHAEAQGGESLYLDFDSGTWTTDIILAALRGQLSERGLVVFDNVHLLDPKVLAEIQEAIRLQRNENVLPGFAAVYVGRETSQSRLLSTKSKGSKAGTDGVATEHPSPMHLSVDAETLECLFDRFVERFPQKLTGTELATTRAQWCSDPKPFGHDLVAFAVALQAVPVQHARGLSEAIPAMHAFLRKSYLDPYPKAERSSLLHLCTLAQFDVDVSDGALDSGGGPLFDKAQGTDNEGRMMPSLQARGIVFQRDVGEKGFRYHLVHSSLARLLLDAARSPKPDQAKILHHCALTDPRIISGLVRALGSEAETKALRDFCKEVSENQGMLAEALFQTPPPNWGMLLETLRGFDCVGPVSRSDAWRMAIPILVRPEYRKLRESWLRSAQLHFLVDWLVKLGRCGLRRNEVETARESVLSMLNSSPGLLDYRLQHESLDAIRVFLKHLDELSQERDELGASQVAYMLAERVLRFLDDLPEDELLKLLTSTGVNLLAAFLSFCDSTGDDRLNGRPSYPSEQQLACTVEQRERFAIKIREVLSKADLSRILCENSSSAVSGLLAEITRSEPEPLRTNSEKTVSSERFRESVVNAIRTSAFRSLLVDRVMDEKDPEATLFLTRHLRSIDPETWSGFCSELEKTHGRDELLRYLESQSLRFITIFLGVLGSYDEDSLQESLVQGLVKNPNELIGKTKSASVEAIGFFFHILRCLPAKAARSFAVRCIAAIRAGHVKLDEFYGPGGAGPTGRFVWNAWVLLGPTDCFRDLWDRKLIKIGHQGLCTWPKPLVREGRPLLDSIQFLFHTLRLWGAISRFPAGYVRSDPATLNGVQIPDSETCDKLLQFIEDPTAATLVSIILGLASLGVSLERGVVERYCETLNAGEAAMVDLQPYMKRAIDEARSWLIHQ